MERWYLPSSATPLNCRARARPNKFQINSSSFFSGKHGCAITDFSGNCSKLFFSEFSGNPVTDIPVRPQFTLPHIALQTGTFCVARSQLKML